MVRNYLITTLRNFVRNRNYTFVNIIGLSIGVTACIIIYLLVSYELSFDKFHSKKENIYRIVQDGYTASGTDHSATIPYPVTGAFRNDFADVPLVTGVHYQEEVLMKVGAEKQHVNDVLFADSLFFEVFDFKVLSGNPRVELGQPGKVFLTQSLANKIMQGRDRLTVKLNNQLELEVAGVIADPPPTSHISFSMIVSFPSLTNEFVNGLDINEWGVTIAGYTYFVMPKTLSSVSVETRLADLVKKYRPQEVKERKLFVQPLSDIHFSKVYGQVPGNAGPGNTGNLIALAVLGVFILSIACINFVNLATALAIRKSKEVGVRKTLGARRGELTAYFLGETFLIILISLLISLGVTEWLLIWINGFTDKKLDLDILGDPALIGFLFTLTIAATLLSGFYPAAVLSGFNPIAIMKNKVSSQSNSGASVRKVLVVFQFTIAQVLIIGTLIVAHQMNYFMNKPLGFNKDAIINVAIPENKKEVIETLRTKVEGISGVEVVSFSLGGPTSDNHFGTGSYLVENGKESRFEISIKPADRQYKDVYGLTLKAGRWFTEAEERSANGGRDEFEYQKAFNKSRYVYVVNESYVKKVGLKSPDDIIGKVIQTGINDLEAEVIGVIEDFHDQSLHKGISPMVIINFPFFYFDAGIKISGSSFKEVLGGVEKAFGEVYPEYEFRYEFLDQYIAKLYRQDQNTFTLFKIFAGISIFIGCLGLYGLISFMANQKQKEVGIRKVLGASVESIVVLFGKEFVKLIFIAFVIASPLTWYFMREWLSGYAFRAPIQWTDFLIGIGATLLVALLTVSYQSIRSAVANPVNALRSE